MQHLAVLLRRLSHGRKPSGTTLLRVVCDGKPEKTLLTNLVMSSKRGSAGVFMMPRLHTLWTRASSLVGIIAPV